MKRQPVLTQGHVQLDEQDVSIIIQHSHLNETFSPCFVDLWQACLNAVLLYQTAMTAVRRRQHRRRLGDTADLDAATDDEDVRV